MFALILTILTPVFSAEVAAAVPAPKIILSTISEAGNRQAAITGSGPSIQPFDADDRIFDRARHDADHSRLYLNIATAAGAFVLLMTGLVIVSTMTLRRRVGRVTKELRESEARLSAIYESAPLVMG